MFGESSDEDDDGCTGHCHGHKDKCFRGDGPQGRSIDISVNLSLCLTEEILVKSTSSEVLYTVDQNHTILLLEAKVMTL